MRNIERADVFSEGRHVGTIVQYDRFRTAFGYTPEWLGTGFSISPFSLPLQSGLFIADKDPFSGLHGVFDDSLPDGWGRLLTDRFLRTMGINPEEITPLTRLCMLSDDAEGFLEYRPALINQRTVGNDMNFDELSMTARRILIEEEVDQAMLDELFLAGGSSGGARPKVYATIDNQHWIVKFPAQNDGMDAGKREYDTNMTARKCGIEVPEARLIPSSICPGFFASKRFDRKEGRRIHTVSLSGLLESSHRFPVLDYSHLMKAVLILAKKEEELWKAYRLAVFNIKIGNMDDHGKNFSFIFDEEKRIWKLAPAYDLTTVSTYYGEHSTTVMGKGKNIADEDLLSLASAFRLPRKNAITEIERIGSIIKEAQNTASTGSQQ